MAAELPRERGRPRPARIGEAAALVGVRPTAVRFWEQHGLLHPTRDWESRYRVYDEPQLRRLRVVALLRRAGYRFPAIRAVLDDLVAGRPQSVIRAMERRRERVAAAGRACAKATGALWRYANQWQEGIDTRA